MLKLFLLPYPDHQDLSHIRAMTDSPSEIELPDNLEARVLAQFDDLLKKGEIFYEPSSPDYVIDKGFQVRVSSIKTNDRCQVLTGRSP